jgi:hypothetical protein
MVLLHGISLKSGEFCKIPLNAIVILKLTQEAEESTPPRFCCRASVTVQDGSFLRQLGIMMTGCSAKYYEELIITAASDFPERKQVKRNSPLKCQIS